MSKIAVRLFCVAAAAVVAGCAGYSWKSGVPAGMRTVSVPVFRNETFVTGLGNEVTRQILREFQREGPFKIVSSDDAALEVQGILTGESSSEAAFSRSTGDRYRESRFKVTAKVSVIDKKRGRVLVDNREYVAMTTYLDDSDAVSRKRDASGRIGEEFARKIIDDILEMEIEDVEDNAK